MLGANDTDDFSNYYDGTMYEPAAGVAVDSEGALYVTVGSHRVLKLSGGVWITIGGDGTEGYSDKGLGQCNRPRGVAVDSGSIVHVVDSGNNRIRKLSGRAFTLSHPSLII